MTTLGKTIDVEGQSFDISDVIMQLSEEHDGDLRKMSEAIEQRGDESYRLQVELYTYAVFEQGAKPKDLTWLSCIIGGNAMSHVAVAASKYRRKALVGVL